MPKPWYSIKAAATDTEVAEVSILDAISDWYGVNARSFLAEFKALKSNKVRVYINSPGGSVVEALAIFNGMRSTGKEIEVRVLGIAASAASYIAMAGDKIVMPANTMMFLHNPINGVYGNADELREAADTLDKFAEVLTATYMKRWKSGEQMLKDTLSAETFLTAAECLEHGLCDEVIDEITATAEFDVAQMPEKVQALFARREPTAPPAMTLADVERVAQAAGVAEFAGVLALDPALTTVAAVEAAARDAAEIVALCRITERPTEAAGFIKARKSYDDVRQAIARAAAEADVHIDTSSPIRPAPKAANDINPSAVMAEFKALRSRAGSPK